MLLGLTAALTAALLFGAGSIVQAIASRHVPLSDGLRPRLVHDLLRQPLFLAAMGLNLTGFCFHFFALRRIPLFLAQSGIAASLVFTALLAVAVFHDHLGTRDWIAVGAVTGGLAMLAAAAGAVGRTSAPPGFVVGLALADVSLALLAAAFARLPSSVATGLLGLLAGFGFAGVGISARVLPDLQPGTLITSGATYTLAASGALAFLIYSLALQRGSVTGATGPMIMSQTITPALVGLIVLDDEIRAGWWPVAVVGFVVTVGGALALARFESAPDHHA